MTMPTQDDVLGYFETLSNWGRWGDDDQLGTLNHITDDVRLAAARAVRHGRSVSCGWEVAVPEEMERSTTACPCAADMPGAEHMPELFHNDRRWGFSNEKLGIFFHGNTITHLDSPCHLFWDGRMYNGRSHELVDADDGFGVGRRHGGGERDRHARCPAGRRCGPRCAVARAGAGRLPRRPRGGRAPPGRAGAIRRRRTPADRLRPRPARGRRGRRSSRRPAGTRPACRGCTSERSR